MKRTMRRDLASGAIMGAAIVASALLGRFGGVSRWSLLAGPALLALATLGADVVDSRSRGAGTRPSLPALILGGAFLLAGAIAAVRGASLLLDLLPIFAGGASVAVLLRGRRPACANLPERNP